MIDGKRDDAMNGEKELEVAEAELAKGQTELKEAERDIEKAEKKIEEVVDRDRPFRVEVIYNGVPEAL